VHRRRLHPRELADGEGNNGKYQGENCPASEGRALQRLDHNVLPFCIENCGAVPLACCWRTSGTEVPMVHSTEQSKPRGRLGSTVSWIRRQLNHKVAFRMTSASRGKTHGADVIRIGRTLYVRRGCPDGNLGGALGKIPPDQEGKSTALLESASSARCFRFQER